MWKQHTASKGGCEMRNNCAEKLYATTVIVISGVLLHLSSGFKDAETLYQLLLCIY